MEDDETDQMPYITSHCTHRFRVVHKDHTRAHGRPLLLMVLVCDSCLCVTEIEHEIGSCLADEEEDEE